MELGIRLRHHPEPLQASVRRAATSPSVSLLIGLSESLAMQATDSSVDTVPDHTVGPRSIASST